MLEGDIVPNASRGESATFRMVVQKAAVQEVFAKYREELYGLYNKYAADDKKDDARDMFNLREFTKMLMDTGVISRDFSRNTVQCIFTNARETRATAVPDEEAEQAAEPEEEDRNHMDHEGFLEALSAVTACVFPNPYVAFEKRLEWTVQQLLREKKGKKGAFKASTYMRQSASAMADVEPDAGD